MLLGQALRTLLRGTMAFALSLGMAVLLFHFIFQPFQVAGLSMAPTLSDRDYLLVDRLFFREAGLRRGDLVVVRLPFAGPFVVKRLVGMPGETVSIRDGEVLINGRPWTHLSGPSGVAPVDFGPVRLGDSEYFLLGDNPPVSVDSRTFGPVGRSRIYGRVLFRYLPVDRVGPLGWPRHAG
jgi:signal peptidase I